MAKKDLNQALIQALKNSIGFLMKKNQLVFPLTFHTYNDLVNKEARGNG
jgi:HD superfamily phosphohydrolase YqeK